MKVKKQLKLLQGFLDSDLRAERKQRVELQDLLKRMKRKEKHLKQESKSETDTERAVRLNHEIEVLHAQRKKGIAALKEAEGRD